MKTIIKSDLSSAKNIGATIAKRLNEIGVYALPDLAEMTSVEAYKRICAQHPDKTMPVCYYLYSLEGALLDVHWEEVPKEIKEGLLAQL